MEFKAGQIAELVKGKLIGNPDTTVKAFSKIEEAVAGDITFLANPK